MCIKVTKLYKFLTEAQVLRLVVLFLVLPTPTFDEGVRPMRLETLSDVEDQRIESPTNRFPASYSYEDELIVPPLQLSPSIERMDVLDLKSPEIQHIKLIYDERTRREDFLEFWGMQNAGIYNRRDNKQENEHYRNVILSQSRRRVTEPYKDDVQMWLRETGDDLKREWFGDHEDDMNASGQRVKTVNSSSASKAQSSEKDTKDKQNYELKLKPRPLRGRLFLSLLNPYLDANATLTVDGRNEVNLLKHFEQIRLHAFVNYDLTNEQYVAVVNKQFLTHMVVQVRSQGGGEFRHENVFQVFYNTRF